MSSAYTGAVRNLPFSNSLSIAIATEKGLSIIKTALTPRCNTCRNIWKFPVSIFSIVVISAEPA